MKKKLVLTNETIQNQILICLIEDQLFEKVGFPVSIDVFESDCVVIDIILNDIISPASSYTVSFDIGFINLDQTVEKFNQWLESEGQSLFDRFTNYIKNNYPPENQDLYFATCNDIVRLIEDSLRKVNEKERR